jgi:uncharacterized membrane protein
MATRSNTQVQTPPATGVRFRFYHASLLLLVAGLLVTGYMSYAKLAEQPLVCADTGIIDCATVESSAWAYFMGIPTAIWGFSAHVLIGILLLLETRLDFFKQNAPLLLFGVTLFGVIYHSYLIYISLFVLVAICPWCVTAASIMLGQFIITIARIRVALAAA